VRHFKTNARRSVGRVALRRAQLTQSRSCDRDVRFGVSCYPPRARRQLASTRHSRFREVRRAAVMNRALSSAREDVRRRSESVRSRTVRGACATRLHPVVAARVRILQDLLSAPDRKGDSCVSRAMRPDPDATSRIANARTSLTSRRAFRRERRRDPVGLDRESRPPRLGCSETPGSWPSRSNPHFSRTRASRINCRRPAEGTRNVYATLVLSATECSRMSRSC